MCVGKVAIEREGQVTSGLVDRSMEGLDRTRATGHTAKRFIELAEVSSLDDDVKFAEGVRAESELSARKAVALDFSLIAKVVQVGRHTICELDVGNARSEVAPDMIKIHAIRPFAVAT